MSDDFESLIERRRENESRVHVDLTDPFRERLHRILATISTDSKARAFGSMSERLGYTVLQENILPESNEPTEIISFVNGKTENADARALLDAETIFTLSYSEYVLKSKYKENSGYTPTARSGKRSPQLFVRKIQRALESEGILWELNNDSPGEYRFKEMGSEMMQEADDELQSLALGETWEEPLQGYNEAYELYLDRKYGKEIPEKLYNSIEAVVQTICVDLEGWEDSEDRNLKHYLDILREKEVFAPNNIMKAEVGDLVDSMEKAFSKAGNDRKNRHELIDRRYCTLMLHQVSAYLVFVIKRYEDEYGSSS